MGRQTITKLEVVTFHIKHLEVMDIRDKELECSFGLEDFYERIRLESANAVGAGTFMYDGRIMCCAGFSELHPGVATGWIVPSKYIFKAPITFCKAIRGYVDAILRDFDFHRLQTTSFADPYHERWMKWLGFELEATMKQFLPNQEDMGLYRRLAK